MYADYPPHMVPRGIEQVLVLEGGEDPNEVIAMAREIGATHHNGDGEEIFWVVYLDDPRRAWDYTEAALRADLRRAAR